MTRKPLTKKWTDEEIVRLNELADSGATLMRAAAALNRATGTVQKKARELGKKFPGMREVREGLRDAGAIEPK